MGEKESTEQEKEYSEPYPARARRSQGADERAEGIRWILREHARLLHSGELARAAWARELRKVAADRRDLEKRDAELRAERPDSFLRGTDLVHSLRAVRGRLHLAVRCSPKFADEVLREFGLLAALATKEPLVVVARTSIGGTEIRIDFELVDGFDGGDIVSRAPWPSTGKVGRLPSPWVTVPKEGGR